ncbi:LysR substrate-binding domain-containing protein [Klebsiella electrica]|uniref:LysR substrate-binding domain-containing protein n=1 Tax=Klebsiella electrica TaxID=1259973 RepID=UPI00387EE170
MRHHQCLTYPRGTQSPQWTFESREQPGERLSVKVHGPFATNNSESLRDAVLAGLGIALLPDFSAREAIGRGLVQELLPGDRLRSSRQTRMSSGPMLRAVETFSHYLKHTFN